MPAARGNVTVSAEMPADLRNDLDERATLEGRSRSDAIKAAIRFWLEYAEVMPARPAHRPKPADKKK